MRSSSLAIVISLQSLSYYCNGFSPLVQVQHKNNNNGLSAATEKERQPSLFAITHHHNDNSDERVVIQLPNKVATIAATTTLALSLITIMGASSSVAAYDYHQSLPTTTITSSSITSSTIQVGASYSESDFADFSLPSYSDVASAEINTNLKGGKDLLDDQYKDMTR